MTNLPQLHDWFAGLLTPGQWVFAYIVAAIATLIFLAWVMWGEDAEGTFPTVMFGAAFLPPLGWFAIMGLLHFLSFMIYLLFSGV